MRSFFTRLGTVLASIMLIVALLIISIEMFAFNPVFFQREYEKLNTAESIGIGESDLTVVTKNLLDYTAGERETLDMQVQIRGQMAEVFKPYEKQHMVDVKALYLGARDIRTFCLAGAAALIIISFIQSGKKALKKLCGSFLRVSGAFLIAVAALGIYAAIDFSGFWVSFHRVFFTNDLWQLDPRTDVLIMMVPQQFFSDLVARIIIRFISMFAALNIAAGVGAYLIKRNKEVKEAVKG